VFVVGNRISLGTVKVGGYNLELSTRNKIKVICTSYIHEISNNLINLN
jgi:hypothetical protein